MLALRPQVGGSAISGLPDSAESDKSRVSRYSESDRSEANFGSELIREDEVDHPNMIKK